MTRWQALGEKCELFQPTNPFLIFLWEATACTILTKSVLKKSNIDICVDVGIMKFQFLTDVSKFVADAGFTTCEQLALTHNDDDVVNNEDFYFENFNVSFAIKFHFTHDIQSYLLNEHIDVLQSGSFLNRMKNINYPDFIYTRNCSQAKTQSIFKFITIPSDWEEFTKEIEYVFEFEKKFPFTFKCDDYSDIFDLLNFKDKHFLQKIVQWNTRVKLHPETNVKMILLTLYNGQSLSNVCFISYPRDLRYIWKIDLSKLTAEQIGNLTPLVPGRLNEFYDGTLVSKISKETQFEMKFLSGRLPSTCIDVVNAEMEQDLEQFIHEDKNNIVFLFPLKSSDQMAAACYERSNLEQSNVFYECKKPDKPSSAMVVTSYFRLDVREFPIYISDDNYFFLLETPSQFFIVNETPKVLNLTVSRGIVEKTEDHVSGDHCQDGTSKTVSVIFPIDASSLKEAVFHVEGGNRKRTRYES